MTKIQDLPIESRVLCPPAEYPSLELYYPTLALKMAGHGVAGCLLGCRPRELSITTSDAGFGTYDTGTACDAGDRAAIVALAGHAALNIAKFKGARLAAGFQQSAFTIDVHNAMRCLDPDDRDDERLIESLRVQAHQLLAREWSAVIAVARQLGRDRRMDGETLGKIVDASAASAPPRPRSNSSAVA